MWLRCVSFQFNLSICTGILRYLGGRFPETTSSTDEHGRTALHYAATIKDNGHFYNLLVHLGSNPKAIDKVIRSAELVTNKETIFILDTNHDYTIIGCL